MMRTLIASVTLAVAALCVCAAPQARSFSEMDARMFPMPSYPKQMPPPPAPLLPYADGMYDRPAPPPFADGQYGRPPPPPSDGMRPHRDQDDGHCSIGRIIGWIVDEVAKLLGLKDDQNHGDFDLGKFWDRLTGNWHGPTTSSPDTWTWTSAPSWSWTSPPPPPNFWGNMSVPEPWVSGRPNFTINFPSSPSMPGSSPPRKGRPSGTGTYSSGGASVMGFPSSGGSFSSGPTPMYDTVQIKSEVIKPQYIPMMAPEMQAMQMGGMQMQGMQANMQMQGMQMASQAKATAAKPMVAVGSVAGASTVPKAAVPAKPVVPAVAAAAAKPVVPAAAKPVVPAVAQPVVPAVAKPVAPVAAKPVGSVAKPPAVQTLRGR